MGALTSKPFAFSARSWELVAINSIDTFDSLGSNIRIDVRGTSILRVMPRQNDDLNEEWITDKVRFSYDGLKYSRLLNPLRNFSFCNSYFLLINKLSTLVIFNKTKSKFFIYFCFFLFILKKQLNILTLFFIKNGQNLNELFLSFDEKVDLPISWRKAFSFIPLL